MDFFFYLALFATISLLIYSVITYINTAGTFVERLAAAWRGSMTIFTLVWTTIVGLIVSGADYMAAITGDPQFAAVGAAIKDALGPSLAPYVSIGILALPLILGTIARSRTLPKS